MAGFKISRPYNMPREQVRSAAEALASKLSDQHGLKCQWQGDCVSLDGKGVKGQLDFSGDTIDVNVKLGMLASAFQGVLKKEVQRYLDEHIS